MKIILGIIAGVLLGLLGIFSGVSFWPLFVAYFIGLVVSLFFKDSS